MDPISKILGDKSSKNKEIEVEESHVIGHKNPDKDCLLCKGTGKNKFSFGEVNCPCTDIMSDFKKEKRNIEITPGKKGGVNVKLW
jgi:ferredoxin-thioredoxin reductase catalytic subunit